MYSVLVLLLSSSQSSVLGSGFGSLNAPKPVPTSDIRTSEQLNGPRLGQRASQTLATTSNSVSKDAGPPPIQSPAPASSPSVEIKAQRLENGPVTALHCKFNSKVNKNLSTTVHCSTLVVKYFSVLSSGDEASARTISGAQPAGAEAATVLHPSHHRASAPVSVACSTGPHTTRYCTTP